MSGDEVDAFFNNDWDVFLCELVVLQITTLSVLCELYML